MKETKMTVLVVGVLIFGLSAFMGCEKAKTAALTAQQKDVVATVGNQTITMKDVDERIAKLPSYYQAMLKTRKKELVDDMVLEVLLYDEANKKGIQNDKEVKEMLAEAQRKIMITKLIKDEVELKVQISDKDVEDYYAAHKDEFITPERWRASHILLKTEAEAKTVLDELSKGKSFEDLAKEKSQDASAKKGGDLGYFTKGQMIPEFEEAVAKLEVGKLSGAVKTQFGYHVIKLTDKKPAEVQELSAVSPRIKNELLSKKRQEAFSKLVDGLKAKSKVVINDSLLVEAKPPVAAQAEVAELPVAPVAVEIPAPAPQPVESEKK